MWCDTILNISGQVEVYQKNLVNLKIAFGQMNFEHIEETIRYSGIDFIGKQISVTTVTVITVILSLFTLICV